MIVFLLWVFGIYLIVNGFAFFALIGKPRPRVTGGYALWNLIICGILAALLITAANTIGALQ